MMHKKNISFKSILNYIKSRLNTEKSTNFAKENKYTFIVNKNLKKKKIKLLFKEIYQTSVHKINTCILPKKLKNLNNVTIKKPIYKKIYITFKALI